MLPRKDVNFIPIKGEKVGWKTDSSGKEIAKILSIDVADVKKSASLEHAFNESRNLEIEQMKELRSENTEKKKTNV